MAESYYAARSRRDPALRVRQLTEAAEREPHSSNYGFGADSFSM